MSHQKDCYHAIAGILHPSGGRIGHLVGAPEASEKHFDHVGGHSTPQRGSTNEHGQSQDSFRRDEIVVMGVATVYRLFKRIVAS